MELDAVREIARLISDGDEAVLAELTGCVEDTAAYFAAHSDRFAERCIFEAEDWAQIRWLGMVDILETHGHVCERDWKDEKEDFFYFLQNLKGTKRLGLEMREEWLDKSGDIPAWCAVLGEKWAEHRCCVAAISIDSDSYVLFPCKLDVLEQLERLAAQTAYCIEKV